MATLEHCLVCTSDRQSLYGYLYPANFGKFIWGISIVPYRSIHPMGNCGIFRKLTVGSRACPHGWRSMASLHFLEIDHSDVSWCNQGTAIIMRIIPVTVGDKNGEPCTLLTSNFACWIMANLTAAKSFIHSNSNENTPFPFSESNRPLGKLRWPLNDSRTIFSSIYLHIYIYIYLSIVYLLLSLLCTILMLL